ncbi:methionine/alanine import family NSS transporter small subunit [Anoxybacillus sp. TBDG-1]
METSALIMMLVGMVIIWGGFVASVAHAVKKSRQS